MSETAITYMVSSKYNYTYKFAKAMDEGNVKYIKSLIKRGKVVPIEVDVVRDRCGNFSYGVV